MKQLPVTAAIGGLKILVTADWWAELSPEGKSEYIAEHPNSKFARNKSNEHTEKHERTKAQQELQEKQKQAKKESKPAPAPEAKKPSSFKDMLMKALPRMKPKEQEFWKNDGQKAGSEYRRSMGQLVKDKSKGVVTHLKGQATEWKDGCKAIHKFAKKQPLTDHDKKAMRALALDIVVTTASVAVGGGFGHGLVGLMQHYALDIVRDCTAKAVFHGVTRANLITAAESMTDEQMMRKIVDAIGDYIENADISEEQWARGLEEIDT